MSDLRPGDSLVFYFSGERHRVWASNPEVACLDLRVCCLRLVF
jgi:hypothetical protein